MASAGHQFKMMTKMVDYGPKMKIFFNHIDPNLKLNQIKDAGKAKIVPILNCMRIVASRDGRIDDKIE